MGHKYLKRVSKQIRCFHIRIKKFINVVGHGGKVMEIYRGYTGDKSCLRQSFRFKRTLFNDIKDIKLLLWLKSW